MERWGNGAHCGFDIVQPLKLYSCSLSSRIGFPCGGDGSASEGLGVCPSKSEDAVDAVRISLAGMACIEWARTISLIQWRGGWRAKIEVLRYCREMADTRGAVHTVEVSLSRSLAVHLDRKLCDKPSL